MNKVLEILQAWSISVNPNELQKEKAKARLEVCMSCSYLKERPFLVCGACGCPLQGKIYTTRTPQDGNCPMKKWPV